jgi:hypothetical protein
MSKGTLGLEFLRHPSSCLAQNPARDWPAQSVHLGAVMKDHSQGDAANPYSPLMCILLLLMVGAATQLDILP